jgi:uncharacterized repeat protein (TIGR03803 family)
VLINVNGILYGTTSGGGNTGCTWGCGTVFSVDPATGTEIVLYAFCSMTNCSDGQNPVGLINVDGVFFGAAGGGVKNAGIVFEITP